MIEVHPSGPVTTGGNRRSRRRASRPTRRRRSASRVRVSSVARVRHIDAPPTAPAASVPGCSKRTRRKPSSRKHHEAPADRPCCVVVRPGGPAAGTGGGPGSHAVRYWPPGPNTHSGSSSAGVDPARPHVSIDPRSFGWFIFDRPWSCVRCLFGLQNIRTETERQAFFRKIFGFFSGPRQSRSARRTIPLYVGYRPTKSPRWKQKLPTRGQGTTQGRNCSDGGPEGDPMGLRRGRRRPRRGSRGERGSARRNRSTRPDGPIRRVIRSMRH